MLDGAGLPRLEISRDVTSYAQRIARIERFDQIVFLGSRGLVDRSSATLCEQRTTVHMATLEDLLEDESRVHFYDLLGGLADNLLTIGTYAGTFMSCGSCGETFSLKGQSWKCEQCGSSYELKFKPAPTLESPFETVVRVNGLDKPRMNPHWYYENENWCVAEFLTQILRLQPESFLLHWFKVLGLVLQESELESILCWPRFAFGKKTIQPDFAVGFRNDIVFVEFKRPKGGTIPPTELMGQLSFLKQASKRLGRRWHFLLIPGRNISCKSKSDYAQAALGASKATLQKWPNQETAIDALRETSEAELASRMRVYGWESLLQKTMTAVEENVPASWTKKQTLAKLAYFHRIRVQHGLFSVQ